MNVWVRVHQGATSASLVAKTTNIAKKGKDQ